MLYHIKIQEENQIDLLQKNEEKSVIILHNDEVNTFDYVIDCLIEICEHDLIQAEQCTMIVHYNGKCDVKTGSYNDLKPLCEALLKRGLSAEIK